MLSLHLGHPGGRVPITGPHGDVWTNQDRKFEGDLAETSAEGATRSCGAGSGGLFFKLAPASAASMKFTALPTPWDESSS